MAPPPLPPPPPPMADDPHRRRHPHIATHSSTSSSNNTTNSSSTGGSSSSSKHHSSLPPPPPPPPLPSSSSLPPPPPPQHAASADRPLASSSTPPPPSNSALPPPQPPLPLPLQPHSLPPPHLHHHQLLHHQLQQQQHLQQQNQQQQSQQHQRLLSLHLSSSSPPPGTHLQVLPPLACKAPPPSPTPDRHSRDDCWSEGATLTLIHSWGDRYLELNRGNLKQKHWKDVADCVNRRADGCKVPKTDVQCKNRLDTLKKKYKLEKSKIVTGGGPSKWGFFERLDELIGPSKKPKKPTPVKARPPVVTTGKRPVDEAEQKPLFNPTAATNHVVSAADTISKSKESPDMTDSCPNGLNNTAEGKSLRRKRSRDSPFKDLARAVLKFGEVYERIETAKQQQLMDLEKQRMEFTKDLELQRLQLFMQTQVELAKMKHSRHGSTEHYI